MPDMAVDDIVQVTARLSLFNQTLLNTFHYRVSLVNAPVNYESAIVGLDGHLSNTNNLWDKYVACLQQDVTLVEVWYQRVSPTRLYVQKKTKGTVGLRVTDSFTANVAAFIERRTATATRRSVGGIHVPTSGGGGSTVGGLLTVGLKADLQALADQMMAGFTTNTGFIGWTPVLFGPFRPAKGDKPAVPEHYEDLIDTSVWDTTRVMRRRTVGVGI